MAYTINIVKIFIFIFTFGNNCLYAHEEDKLLVEDNTHTYTVIKPYIDSLQQDEPLIWDHLQALATRSQSSTSRYVFDALYLYERDLMTRKLAQFLQSNQKEKESCALNILHFLVENENPWAIHQLTHIGGLNEQGKKNVLDLYYSILNKPHELLSPRKYDWAKTNLLFWAGSDSFSTHFKDQIYSVIYHLFKNNMYWVQNCVLNFTVQPNNQVRLLAANIITYLLTAETSPLPWSLNILHSLKDTKNVYGLSTYRHIIHQLMTKGIALNQIEQMLGFEDEEPYIAEDTDSEESDTDSEGSDMDEGEEIDGYDADISLSES